MGSQGFLACPEGYLGGPSWLKIPGTWKKIPARWHFLALNVSHLLITLINLTKYLVVP